MKYYVISEKGKRDKNEDCLVAKKINDLYVFGIADGMGGHARGEFASKIAIGELKESFKRKGQAGLIDGFEKANDTIVNENARRQSNMGTTLAACSYNEKTGECIIAHVGDSRVYIFGDKIWKTTDHSMVQNLVKKGVIAEEEAFGHPQKNIVTKALGLEKRVDIDINKKIIKNANLLLCSDGLSDYVNDEEIAKIVEKYRPEMVCKKLVKKALDNGSKDNITIIVVNLKD